MKLIQTIMRIGIGVFMLNAAYGHFLGNPADFEAIVPDWLPFSAKFIVISSGIVEVILGLAAIFLQEYHKQVGWVFIAFLILVFPANLYQYTHHIDAFGLDTDAARLNRLYMQLGMLATVIIAFNVFNWPVNEPMGDEEGHRRLTQD